MGVKKRRIRIRKIENNSKSNLFEQSIQHILQNLPFITKSLEHEISQMRERFQRQLRRNLQLLAQLVLYKFQYQSICYNIFILKYELKYNLPLQSMKSIIAGVLGLASVNSQLLYSSQATQKSSSLGGPYEVSKNAKLSAFNGASSSGGASGQARISAAELLNGALNSAGINSGNSNSISFSSGSTGGSFGLGAVNGLNNGLNLARFSTSSGSSSNSNSGYFTSNSGLSINRNALNTGSNSNLGFSNLANLSNLSGYSGMNGLNPGGFNSLGGLTANVNLGSGSGLNGYNLSTGGSGLYGGLNNNMMSSSNINTFRVINQASQNLVTPNRSLNSIFLRFPSVSQLDRLIVSADTAAILKTIQTIATDSSASCNQRITYLMELQGRLKTAIQKKTFSSDQLKIVISSSAGEIQRLQNQVQSTKRLVAGLGISDLKDRQTKQIALLQDAYKKFNNIDGQIPILQARLNGFLKQIEILTRNSQGQRNKVSNDKLKLADILSQIGNLQSKLKELQDKQAAISLSISKGLAKITDNDNSINNLRIKASQIEVDIKKIKDEVDRSNTQVRDLEVKVERIRTDINIGEAKKQKFLKQISDLDDKINFEKKKAVENDLVRINEMINTLKSLVPLVEGAIDRHYYSCFGQGNDVKVDQSGNTSVYIVSGDHFRDYLQNLYGITSVLPSLNRSEIMLNRVNIFGEQWAGRFGYPFGQTAFGSQDFSFAGSFSCLNPGSVVTGSATITGVGANFLEGKDDSGNVLRFNLGSCSRLESTLKLPNPGQKLFWSGVPGSQGFNLYGGSCFE